MNIKEEILRWYAKKHLHGDSCLCDNCRWNRMNLSELSTLIDGFAFKKKVVDYVCDSCPNERGECRNGECDYKDGLSKYIDEFFTCKGG